MRRMKKKLLGCPFEVGLFVVLSLMVGVHEARGDAVPAQGALVAVLPPDFSPDVSDGARALLTTRLVEGLREARFEVVEGGAIENRLAGRQELATCRTAACVPELAQALRVAYVVMATVVQKERTYDIRLVLHRGRGGEVAAEVRERCDICGIEEAAEKMSLSASSLRRKLEALMTGPARLLVRSSPSGAYVYLDGREVGKTPLEVEAQGGRHVLRVQRRGHMAVERTVMLVPEVEESVDVTLVPAPSTFPYMPAGIGALGTGLLTLGAGVFLVMIDGREVPCDPGVKDPYGNCPKVRDTRLGGAVLMAIGGAVATGGGFLLFLGRDRGMAGPERRAWGRGWNASVVASREGAHVVMAREF